MRSRFNEQDDSIRDEAMHSSQTTSLKDKPPVINSRDNQRDAVKGASSSASLSSQIDGSSGIMNQYLNHSALLSSSLDQTPNMHLINVLPINKSEDNKKDRNSYSNIEPHTFVNNAFEFSDKSPVEGKHESNSKRLMSTNSEIIYSNISINNHKNIKTTIKEEAENTDAIETHSNSSLIRVSSDSESDLQTNEQANSTLSDLYNQVKNHLQTQEKQDTILYSNVVDDIRGKTYVNEMSKRENEENFYINERKGEQTGIHDDVIISTPRLVWALKAENYCVLKAEPDTIARGNTQYINLDDEEDVTSL